jgi:hypothetical protein
LNYSTLNTPKSALKSKNRRTFALGTQSTSINPNKSVMFQENKEENIENVEPKKTPKISRLPKLKKVQETSRQSLNGSSFNRRKSYNPLASAKKPLNYTPHQGKLKPIDFNTKSVFINQ